MENNIVNYLDKNFNENELMKNITQLPVSKPTFDTMPTTNVAQNEQRQHISPPITQEQMMMMQNITDARQIPNAEIITLQEVGLDKPSIFISFNGQIYPPILFKEEVLNQIRMRQIPARSCSVQQQQPVRRPAATPVWVHWNRRRPTAVPTIWRTPAAVQPLRRATGDL